jgi:uncharacterized protein YaiE (UPF0345 family)
MSRLITRGTGVESPADTFNIVASNEMTLKTGLGEAEIVVTGANTATLLLTFAFGEPAADFPNDTEWINFCGDYEIQTSTLPASVGVEISDTLTFADADALDAFVNQLRADFSLEIKLK